MIALTLVICGLTLKGYIKDVLTEADKTDNPYSKMYKMVKKYENQIFSNLCTGLDNIQSCSVNDKLTIFEGDIPNGIWFDVAFLFEKGVRCSGISEKLDLYYFTTWKKELPQNSCADKIHEFLESKEILLNFL